MSNTAVFVHLRVLSAFSLCEGAIPVGQVVGLAATNGMPAVAITDRNNLFGALEFSEKAVAKGVQPIIGAALDIALADDEGRDISDSLVLLCQNEIGYLNLCHLVSRSHLGSPDPTRPLLPADGLDGRTDGLIALWGGSASALVACLTSSSLRARLDPLVACYQALFPDRLYLEIQRCGEPFETVTEAGILNLAEANRLPIVATNDVYFADAAMHAAHDALLCVKDGTYVSDSERRRLTPEHWFKPADVMAALFADLPDAIENAGLIARRCAFKVGKRKPMLPVYQLAGGEDASEGLRREARAGFEERFAATVVSRLGEEAAAAERPRYEERLAFELDVITRMDFAGYFLIVSDFMKWAKAHDIPVGVRGSGATSIVAWSLYITHLDPVRFNLVFERFLNPERISMPDFDIDFCQERRGEVIQYVCDKYGADRVAQIITFGKLQARAAIRDVGRVLQIPYPVVDKICALIGTAPTLDQALKDEPRLGELCANDEAAKRLFEVAVQLEGLYRHASTHAAGLVIGDRPLEQLVPLYKDPSSDMPVTQFHFKDVEKAGLVKFDFLGLRTLTIIAKAQEYIFSTCAEHLRASELDFFDEGLFTMLANGESTGVFQLESAGMRDLLRGLRPDRFEQLIALISLYRPGPMHSIPAFIARARGSEPVAFEHPILAPVLAETYGIITYQEDVMQIARDMAGYSLGEADLLRRAMGKKIQSEMDVHQEKFIEGAIARGVPKDVARSIFEQCAKFAGYGFNKGHAAAYAQIAYQTAYLKHHYPVEFYAACMTLDRDRTERLDLYRTELAAHGYAVHPPDINASGADFTIEREDDGRLAIRYALTAIRGVGQSVAEAIVAERRKDGPFRDLFDVFARLGTQTLHKGTVERLIMAGAFDSLERNRARLLANLPRLLRYAHDCAGERLTGQPLLFAASTRDLTPELEPVPPRRRLEDLEDELVAFGFYMSSHPLVDYEKALQRLGVMPVKRALDRARADRLQRATVAGVLHRIQRRRAKSGSRYAFLTLSDTTGSFEVMAFSEVLQAAEDWLVAGTALVVNVSVSKNGEDVRMTAEGMEKLDERVRRISQRLTLAYAAEPSPPWDDLKAALAATGPGETSVHVTMRFEDGRTVTVALFGAFGVTAQFVDTARTRLGAEAATLQ